MARSDKDYNALAVDLGFRATGYVVIHVATNKVVHIGCLREPKDSDESVAESDTKRCKSLADGLRKVIKDYSVVLLVGEVPTGGSKSARATRCMGMVTGVVASLEVPDFFWVTPKDVKVLVGKKGKVEKKDVELVVRSRWPDLMLPKIKADREHISDALGAWLAYLNKVVENV